MVQQQDESTGVLLIAHGSRRAEANADLARLAEIVRARQLFKVVEFAYLELVEPTIPQGARRCVDQGVNRVLMMPFFLSAGRHVTGDLERFRRELSAEYPCVSFQLCQPLGLHPLLIEAVVGRLREGKGRGTRGEG